jgi:ABC-2 type transport system ATP-binding protein
VAAHLVEATDLHKAFGDRQAVDGVDLRIAPGETYGLLGPNGAGKSTTISMLAGLLEPDRGSVVVDGVPIRPGSPHGRGAIGLVPQELAIYPELSAVQNLRFFARLQGMGRAEIATRTDEVLELVGLTDRRKEATEKFSGGMKRRLNIGIGLLHHPKLLILDEPTVGVDPQSRTAILEAVAELATGGMAVLYTTHYMEEAERLCDRVAIMDEGRVLAEGTRAELVARVARADRVVIRTSRPVRTAAEKIRAMPTVDEVSLKPDGVEVLLRNAPAHLSAILASVSEEGVPVVGVDLHQQDLESVFLALTGKGLRD